MLRPGKMLTRMVTVLFAAAVLAVAGPVADAQEPKVKAGQQKEEKEQSTSFWMERKLRLSQDLLAGITAADFDKIAASAQAMRALNKVEAFVRSRTPGYRTQLQIFDESLEEIVRQADKDNVEGAALGFTQLTISCVNCHKQLRAAK
ncbi:MAG TPA: hypothetical protein VMP01_27245 [Pirellulaceae bacterium]|nr:hypothetical protein [Pirellulaceae bacterium]